MRCNTRIILPLYFTVLFYRWAETCSVMDFNLKQEDRCDWQYFARPCIFIAQRNV